LSRPARTPFLGFHRVWPGGNCTSHWESIQPRKDALTALTYSMLTVTAPELVQLNMLHLCLTFFDELRLVRADAVTDTIDSQMAIMGTVQSKDQLQDLLETAGVDHYIVCSGDPFTPTFQKTTRWEIPEIIVERLEKEFSRRRHDLPSLHVRSSSMETHEGLKRVARWFSGRKTFLLED
jgi:hypothetical protein